MLRPPAWILLGVGEGGGGGRGAGVELKLQRSLRGLLAMRSTALSSQGCVLDFPTTEITVALDLVTSLRERTACDAPPG